MVAKVLAHCKEIKELLLGPGFHTVSGFKKFLLTWVRMWWVVLKGFRTDLLTMRAASLTYVTLISIIPFLAIFFSILKAFGSGMIEKLTAQVSSLPPGAAEFVNKIVGSVQKVDATQLGVVSFLVTIFTAMKLLTNIEMSFNNIWGTKEHRTFMDKCVYYSATCILGSILVVVSFSFTASLNSEKFQLLVTEYFGPLDKIIFWCMSLSGLFSIIIAFTVLYVWMPNVKVKILPAIAGGLSGGLTWKLMQVVYVKFQMGISKSNGIEGSFAAIPLFLAWLYVSWLIVLFGAEVAFAVQHWRTYDLEGPGRKESFLTKMSLGVVITLEIARDFVSGKLGWEPESFAKNKMISRRLVGDVIHILSENDIIRKVDGKDNYVPGKSIDHLSLADIENAFRGMESPSVAKCEDQGTLAEALKNYHLCLETHHQQLNKLTVRELIKES